MMRARLIAAALALGAACGGAEEEETVPPAGGEEEARADGEGEDASQRGERAAVAEVRARREAACRDMCERLTICAVADAEAHQPEELEGEDLDELADAHTRACVSQCRDSEPGPDQVETIEACVDAQEGCEPLLDCLDAV